MLCMVPISHFDKRNEMRGKFNVIMSGIMHLVLSLWISYLYLSWRIIIIYAIESVIYVSVAYIKHKTGDGSKPLKKS